MQTRDNKLWPWSSTVSTEACRQSELVSIAIVTATALSICSGYQSNLDVFGWL